MRGEPLHSHTKNAGMICIFREIMIVFIAGFIIEDSGDTLRFNWDGVCIRIQEKRSENEI